MSNESSRFPELSLPASLGVSIESTWNADCRGRARVGQSRRRRSICVLISVFGFTTDGPGFSEANYVLAQPVALVGAAAAREFESPLVPGSTITLDGIDFHVAGIVTDARRGANALSEVLVPAPTALDTWPSRRTSARVVIEVEVGAAHLIAQEAPLVIRTEPPGTSSSSLPTGGDSSTRGHHDTGQCDCDPTRSRPIAHWHVRHSGFDARGGLGESSTRSVCDGR